MIVQKSVTPRDLSKLEEVYTEANQRCSAFWLPHAFKAGASEIKMCWQGRLDRAQTLVSDQPGNEVLAKAYDQLCQQADAYQENAHKAREWYLAECARLNQTPKKLPQDGECECDYCRKVSTHFDWLRAEIEYGGAVHDLICGPATIEGEKIVYGEPAILGNPDQGKELIDKLIKAMSEYKESCNQQGQQPDWTGAAYGWKRKV